MRKGLFIVAKDVDAHLASYINKSSDIDFSIDLVVLRHRDKIEFSKKFKNIDKIYSLSEYLSIFKDAKKNESSCDLSNDLKYLEEMYSLRSSNRYSYYDFYRARSGNEDIRKNDLLNLCYVSFFQEVFSNNYEFVMGELSRSFNLICYDLCFFYGVQYLHPVNAGGLNGVLFVDDKFHIRCFDLKLEAFNKNIKTKNAYIDDAEKYVEAFLDKPAYEKTFISSTNIGFRKLYREIWRKSVNLLNEYKSLSIDKKNRVDYIYSNPIVRVLKRDVIRKIKAKLIRRFVFSNDYTIKPNSFYFPLHVHPETTTSLYSEYYVDNLTNQGTSVEFLSKVMPTGSTLIVKEHPAMVGTRPINLYKNYRKPYNVDLVGPDISQFEIIKNSKGVISLCGTVGLEALMLGKPVFLLTHSYYDYFSQIVKVGSIADLEGKLLSSFNFVLDDQALVQDFGFLMYCAHDNVFNFLIDDNAKAVSDENLKLFSRAIVNELDWTTS